MMVAPINPIREEMMPKLKKARLDGDRVDEIVAQGFIGRRFGEYTKQLIMLDFLADEAEVFVRYRDFDRSVNSLTQMKFKLDSVAGVLMADGELETEKVGNLSVIKNPNFDNIQKYRELYDFAQQKYEDAVSKCEQMWETAA